MIYRRDQDPNRIENDLTYADARREGCTATRGPLNLGTGYGYPACDPRQTPVRSYSSWWLVAACALLAAVAMRGLGL